MRRGFTQLARDFPGAPGEKQTQKENAYMRRAAMVIGLVCVFSVAAVSLNAGYPERTRGGRVAGPPLRQTQAPQPGPEMQRLNFLIGTWDTVSEYEKSPMMPAGGKQKGWYKAQLGPGGFSVIADLEEDSPAGKDIGHEIVSWDPKKGVYDVVVLGNAFPGAILGTGKWDGDDLVILNDVGSGASAVHFRAAYLHPQGNVLHIEESFSVGDAPPKLMYKATATKR
jgi:hypothetical protein